MTPFENFLKQHDEEAWAGTLTTLLRSIHEVDRNATQIWFSFYPLALFEALQRTADPEKLAQQLLMQGVYRLRGQIDSSPPSDAAPDCAASSARCSASSGGACNCAMTASAPAMMPQDSHPRGSGGGSCSG